MHGHEEEHQHPVVLGDLRPSVHSPVTGVVWNFVRTRNKFPHSQIVFCRRALFTNSVLKLADRSVLVMKQYIVLVLLVVKKDNVKQLSIVAKKALMYFLMSGRNIFLCHHYVGKT